jgi:hypothetical protein
LADASANEMALEPDKTRGAFSIAAWAPGTEIVGAVLAVARVVTTTLSVAVLLAIWLLSVKAKLIVRVAVLGVVLVSCNVKKLIETKLEGGKIAEVEPAKKLAPVVDLMSALKQSLAEMEGKKKPVSTAKSAPSAVAAGAKSRRGRV